MRTRLLLLFFVVIVTTVVQVRLDLAGIVKAEKDIAQISIDQNMRAAFLSAFDDESLAFQRGEPLPVEDYS